MKTRTGFVSNSSSSSFVIATKEELTKENINKAFGVPETGVFKNLAEEMAKVFFNRAKKVTLEEYLEDYSYDSLEDIYDED